MFQFKKAQSRLSVMATLLASLAGNVLLGIEPQDVRPDSKLYLSFSMEKMDTVLNDVQVVGPEIVIARGHENQVYERLDNIKGQKRIALYADKVVVRDPFRTLGADVEVHARELVFEGSSAMIDTTPFVAKVAPDKLGQNGARGGNAGNILLAVQKVTSPEVAVRFQLNGGRGQDPAPGKDGPPGTPEGIMEAKFPCRQMKFDRALCINKTKYPDNIVLESVVKSDSEWPGNGGNAIPAGRAGDGGSGGTLSTTVPIITNLVVGNGGAPGTDNQKKYVGGAAATPRFAMKLNWKRKYRVTGGPAQMYYEATVAGTSTSLAGEDARQTSVAKLGSHGRVVSVTADWYSPRITAASWQYIDDLYFRGDLVKVSSEARKHLSYLESSARNFSPSEQGEVAALQGKLTRVVNQLFMMKDYYGHPMAWVPPLSLESYLHLYREETKHAVRRLYLAKRLSEENDSQTTKQQNTLELQRLLREEIETKAKEHTETLKELPTVQKRLDELEARSLNVKLLSEDLEEDLNELAEKSVENRHKAKWWKKSLKILGGVAMVFPVGQPFVGLAGAAAMTAATYDKKDPVGSIAKTYGMVSQVIAKAESVKKPSDSSPTPDTGPQVPEVSESSEMTKLSESIDRLSRTLGAQPEMPLESGLDAIMPDVEAHLDEMIAQSAAAKTPKASKSVRDKFMKTLGDAKKKGKDVKEVFSAVVSELTAKEAPGEEVKGTVDEITAEFEKLKAENPRFQELITKLNELLNDKAVFDERVKQMLQTLEDSSSQIVANMAQIAELSAGMNDQTLTPEAALVIKEVQNDAERSLRKYHYYLQKAYAYRFLKRYSGQADLRPLFERMEILFKKADTTLSREDYEDLHVTYHSEVSTILNDLLEGLDSGEEEHEETIRVHFSEAELAKLSFEALPFELLQRRCVGDLAKSTPAPCVDESREDVRIVSAEVERFELQNDSPVPPHFQIAVEHSGLSKFWRNGKLHLFRMYDGSATGRKSWRNTLYDNGEVRFHPPTDSQESLLQAFLPNIADYPTFVRPSAWGDLSLRLKSEAQEKPRLKRLTLKVSYTYRDQSVGQRSWRDHIAAQDESIRKVYRETLGRDPSHVELASKRTMRDLGYSWDRVAQRVRQLSVPTP